MNSKQLILLIIFFSLSQISISQIDTSSNYPYEVPFITDRPEVDGNLDPLFLNFRSHKFTTVEKSRRRNDNFDAQYWWAYGTDFFYLYIEVSANELVERDRGYQNGDGFHLVFAKPTNDSTDAEEFYVLGFSHTKANNTWGRKINWYRNIALEMKILDERVQFQTNISDGKCGFELLLPWDCIYPYHPWFEPLGFNLCFVKAVDKTEKNDYYMLEDNRMQSEQSLRKYVPLHFQTPCISQGIQSYVRLERNYISSSDSLQFEIAGVSANDCNENVVVQLYTGENFKLNRKTITFPLKIGINYLKKKINFNSLPEGGYSMTWRASNSLYNGKLWFSVLPNFNKLETKALLKSYRSEISQGTYNTLMFTMLEIENKFEKLKKYETAGETRILISQMNYVIDNMIDEHDIYKEQRGIFRRAFFSDYDKSYQPYTIKVPDNYDSTKRYPLLVFLHGSGEDDRNILETPRTAGNFIEIAPNGRGTSNCFATTEALIDVREAIDDVLKYYAIDTSNIILGGFSMGGYGVYRVFYEYPQLFKALVVMSGHPNLANEWLEGKHPNFIDDKKVKLLVSTELLIFHGVDDMNCPFELTEKLVKKLNKHEAKVLFLAQEGGHSAMNEENTAKYYEWLEKIINSKK